MNKVFIFNIFILIVLSSKDENLKEDEKRKVYGNICQIFNEEHPEIPLTPVPEQSNILNNNSQGVDFATQTGVFMPIRRLPEEYKQVRKNAMKYKPVQSKNFDLSRINIESDMKKNMNDPEKKEKYQKLADYYKREVVYYTNKQKNVNKALKLIHLFSKEELESIEFASSNKAILSPLYGGRKAKIYDDAKDSPKKQMLKLFELAQDGEIDITEESLLTDRK